MVARRWFLAFAAVGLIGAFGCGKSGPPKVIFGGKVTDGGKAPQAPMGGVAQIAFIRLDGPGGRVDPQMSLIQPDGSYKIWGTKGDGVEPGKYKVTVQVFKTMSDDMLKNKFDEKNSKIERDITLTTTDLPIDLSKPNG